MYNKKAQISEGITWVVATIAIIVILLVSVFITSKAFSLGGNEGVAKSFSFSSYQKSLLSYLLTKDQSGKIVFNQIKDEQNLNDFNGNLGLKVFKGIYGMKNNVWLGVSEFQPTSLTGALTVDYVGKENQFFGKKIIASTLAPGLWTQYYGGFQVIPLAVSSSLYLDKTKNKIVEAVFREK